MRYKIVFYCDSEYHEREFGSLYTAFGYAKEVRKGPFEEIFLLEKAESGFYRVVCEF